MPMPNGSVFWFVMGALFVIVAAGFKAFADERGWVLTWWKALLAAAWYGIVGLTVYACGTLVGENEAEAGLKLLGLGLFVCTVLGAGLWRLLALGRRAP
jgi:hypothetical protein